MEIDPVSPSLLVNGKPIETLNYDTTVKSYTDKDGAVWALPYRSDFMPFINSTFEAYRTSAMKFQDAILKSQNQTERSPPFKYQEFIYEYLKFGTPYRGLLLEHGLGSGKTRTAIMVAESFRAVNIPILILTPAFLTTNFKSEIKKWFDLTDAEIDAAYHFVSYNAGGRSGGQGSALEQLAKLGLGLKNNTAFPYIAKTYPNLAPPKQWFIIIEEMHGLNRSFKETGQSKIRRVIYDLLMAAEDCKILGLSGTPMIEPHELGTMYNILRGPISSTFHAFPENSTEFNKKFLAKDAQGNEVLANSDVFCKRISGLHSYFKGIVGTDVSGRLYPKENRYEIILPMSPYQKLCYEVLTIGADVAEQSISSTFLCQERKLCNFAFPEQLQAKLAFFNAETTVPFLAAKYSIPAEELVQYLLNKDHVLSFADIQSYLTPEDQLIWHEVHGNYKQAVNARLNRLVKFYPEVFTVEGMKQYSPKMAAIFQSLNDPLKGCAHIAPGLAAAKFQIPLEQPLAHLEYIGSPETVLDEDDNISFTYEEPAEGLPSDVYLTDAELDVKYHRNWTVKGGPAMVYSFFSSLEGAGIFSKFLEAQGYEQYRGIPPTSRKPRYAFIRGGMTAAQKVDLLNVFNHPSNKHGQLIKVIFVTLAAVEGISLFNLRQIHIMEPYWDRNIIRQVTGRGFRLKSHFHLPEDECQINVYEYAMTLPQQLTADIIIRNIADKKDRFQADFKKLRMSAAVDCALNINHHLDQEVECFTWPSTDGFIYHNDVNRDIGAQAVEYRVPVAMETIRTKNGVLVWNPNEYVNIRYMNPATGNLETVTSVHRVYLENNLNSILLYVKMSESNVFYRTRYTDKTSIEHIVLEF